MNENARFVLIITLVYSLAYLVAGGLAYQLITKQFYVGDNAIFTAYLRSEASPAEWAHTNTWIFPILLLRGFLLSLVLLPFRDTLFRFSFKKRALVLSLFIFLAAHIAAAAPSPSNLEGFVYMKPEIFTFKALLLTQPEMIAQSLGFGLLASWLLSRYASKK